MGGWDCFGGSFLKGHRSGIEAALGVGVGIVRVVVIETVFPAGIGVWMGADGVVVGGGEGIRRRGKKRR